MNEATLERQILGKLVSVERKVDYIMGYIEDTKLSEDDKKAVDETLKAAKLGKLKTMKEVFG